MEFLQLYWEFEEEETKWKLKSVEEEEVFKTLGL